MLNASNLAPWGTIERSRGASEHNKGDLGVQVWISVAFERISEPHFESCLQFLKHTNVLFVLRAYRYVIE